ncbi:MAG: PAS domain S-box protein [Prochloraceae cyanobacterium]
MKITIATICLLLLLVLFLSIKTIEQAIALKQARQEKKEQTDTFFTQELCVVNTSEKLLYKAFAKAPVPIMVHAEDGEILQINQVWTELTGYSQSEIPTITDWTEKAYGKQQKKIRAGIDRLYRLKGRVDEGEFKILTANKEIRTWDFSSAPLGKLLDGRRLVISIAKDITETKLTQKALERSEDKFDKTFERAAVGIAHLAPDGKWLKVNQKLCKIVGYSRAELLETNFQDLTYSEDIKEDRQYISQMLAGEIESYSMEKRYVRKDGSLVWIYLILSLVRKKNREPDYFISVIEDISDRKQLEISLKKSIQRLSNLHQIDRAILEAQKPANIAQIAVNNIQKLIDSQQISMVTFDREKEKATIIITTTKCERPAINEFEVSLQLWKNIIEKFEKFDRNTNLAMTSCLSQYPQLSQAIPAFQEERLNCFIGFPLKTEGKLLGILKVWIENKEPISSQELEIISEVCTQITIAIVQANLAQKNQTYALELENKVAQRTAELEDINQELKAFTYSISHDLKAPLRGIQGFATALQEDYGVNLDDLGQEYTTRLISCSQQMETLIEDLLSYSRLSRSEIQIGSIALEPIVSAAIEQLKPEIAESGAKISVRQPLLYMLGNQTILIQIVFNLLSNAIKFVPADVKPSIEIWSESKGNSVRLYILDNGIGIAPQYQQRIFKVFERLHGSESYPGTGIGLAIVKKGMERLGGKFGLESNRGHGSCFWIENQR